MLNMRIILVLWSLVVLGGCATGAKVENMSTEPTSLDQKLDFDDGLKAAVAVSEVSGGKKTNPLWKSNVSSEAFQEAVVESLKLNGLHSDTGSYSLNVELQKVKQPVLGGFSMTVTTTVRYVLSDNANSKVLFDEVIVAPHTAKMSDAFVGVKRLRLANEGSAKKNIEALLTKLSELNVSTVTLQ